VDIARVKLASTSPEGERCRSRIPVVIHTLIVDGRITNPSPLLTS